MAVTQKTIQDLDLLGSLGENDVLAVAHQTGETTYEPRNVTQRIVLDFSPFTELTTVLPSDQVLVLQDGVAYRANTSALNNVMFTRSSQAQVTGDQEGDLIGTGNGSRIFETGTLTAGRGVKWDMWGLVGTTDTCNVTLRVKVGAVQIASLTFPLGSGYDGADWRFQGMAIMEDATHMRARGQFQLPDTNLTGQTLTFWLNGYDTIAPSVSNQFAITAQASPTILSMSSYVFMMEGVFFSR
jgi:hypothetical protein